MAVPNAIPAPSQIPGPVHSIFSAAVPRDSELRTNHPWQTSGNSAQPMGFPVFLMASICILEYRKGCTTRDWTVVHIEVAMAEKGITSVRGVFGAGEHPPGLEVDVGSGDGRTGQRKMVR